MENKLKISKVNFNMIELKGGFNINMKNKYKLLIPVLLMGFLLIGFVSAMTEEIIPDSFVIEETISEIGEFRCFNSGVEIDCNFGIVPNSELPIIEPTPSIDFIPADPDEELLIVEPTFVVIEPTLLIEPDTSGKQTFELGYDCYHQSPDLYWGECKQVEHKVSWFEKKDFRRGISCYYDGTDWICGFIAWIRFAKA